MSKHEEVLDQSNLSCVKKIKSKISRLGDKGTNAKTKKQNVAVPYDNEKGYKPQIEMIAMALC